MATFQTFCDFSRDELVSDLKKKKKHKGSNEANTRNIIGLTDHNFLIWDDVDCCLIAKSLAPDSYSKSKRYQTLILTDPPLFQVKYVVPSLDGTSVLLYGPQGVVIVELPHQWNIRGDKFKEKISVRSYPIGEKITLYNSNITIQKCAWHPGSPGCNHLFVLTSDNCMRLYRLEDPEHASQVIPVGKTGQSLVTNRPSFSASLGEVAVSFDFGLPLDSANHSKYVSPERALSRLSLKHQPNNATDGNVRTESGPEKEQELEWPVYVLKGNGYVYTFTSNLSTTSKSRTAVYGPVPMFPPADDNYGSDVCDLLCLPTTPPLLVLATAGLTLYHGVILPRVEGEAGDDDDDLESLLSWSNVSMATYSSSQSVMHVMEALELEAGLIVDKDINMDGGVQLLRDPTTPARYYVCHQAGVHAISLPIVHRLVELANIPDGALQDQPPLNLSEPSHVEHVVCTQVLDMSPAPIQGLLLYPLPPVLLGLLSSYDMVVLPLAPILLPSATPSLLSLQKGTKSTADVPKTQFENHIRLLLQRKTSQPQLKLSGPEPPLQEALQVFTHCLQVLREEYVLKQDLAREEIDKKSRLLRLQKTQQLEEMSMLSQAKSELTENAHRLADKYEDAKEKRNQLMERLESLFLQVQKNSPVISDAEIAMKNELRQIESSSARLRLVLEKLKNKNNELDKQKTKKQETLDIQLNALQLKQVQNVLADQTTKLKTMVQSVQQTRKLYGA